MQGETKEHWVDLCERAATEQDPERLMMLIKELNDLLTQKQERLQNGRPRSKSERSENGSTEVSL